MNTHTKHIRIDLYLKTYSRHVRVGAHWQKGGNGSGDWRYRVTLKPNQIKKIEEPFMGQC